MDGSGAADHGARRDARRALGRFVLGGPAVVADAGEQGRLDEVAASEAGGATAAAVYSVAAGRYHRVLIGETAGWAPEQAGDVSAEDVARNLADIEDRSTLAFPADSVAEFAAAIGGQGR